MLSYTELIKKKSLPPNKMFKRISLLKKLSFAEHKLIFFNSFFFFSFSFYRSYFRTKRRLSIAPLPSLRLNGKNIMANEFDNQSVISNQNSITSVNSLASLLKEKMQVILYSLMQKCLIFSVFLSFLFFSKL